MDDVPDSTDWLPTPLACLAPVEAALRCQVCKDFYKAPVITSCLHTFCSICIRRTLSDDGKCPLCRSPAQESGLRSNWSMEEAVEAFSRARPTVMNLAQAQNSSILKRNYEEVETDESPIAPEVKRTRASARLSGKNIQAEAERGQQVVPNSDDKDGDGSEQGIRPERDVAIVDDNLVSCPSCQKRMKEWEVFQHLETCSGPSPAFSDTSSSNAPNTIQTQQMRQRTTIERLPALNYSILKEQSLRKKLSELGLSNQGPRNLLEKRHKEWLTIWNANCDTAQPRKRSQLMQDLEVWERTHGQRPFGNIRGSASAAVIKDKNFDGAAWAAKHDTSFKDLIRSARANQPNVNKSDPETASGSI